MAVNSFTERLKAMPVPLLPTLVGAATLSNVYFGLGFSWLRHITMGSATILLLIYLLKIIRHPKIVAQEYCHTVPASLYAGFTMLMMILGSYFFDFNASFGKGVWFFGLALHTIHIFVFTFRNVILSRNIETFVPSWFVTYNGIMVSCVVGSGMGKNQILTVVVYYGIIIYFVLITLLIWRLMTKELKEPFLHTLAIVLAPCSLCLVSYLNIIDNPKRMLVWLLYVCVLLSFAFVVVKLPKFFAVPFSPAFAALTFPMAIGIVASTKMAAYLAGLEMAVISNAIKQFSGIQIYLTTAIIGFVLFNFFKMFRGK